MSTQGHDKKRVVIVGGGIGGGLVAKTLQFGADVTLIDPKDFYEIPWANLRAMVEPSFAEKSVINHTDYLTNGRLVISHATSITDFDVFTSDGQQIPYDYLVVATGHEEEFPRTRDGRLKQYVAENEKIKAANSILIVGGGPTGVELAGEIAVDFPKKKLTLVHRGARLLEFVNTKASTRALDWLTAKKVEVILEQTVDLSSASDGTYKTSNGESIAADCHFLCIGKPLGSSWLGETVLKDSLDSRGRLMVDEHLRVKGRKNIFAVGDITDIPEIKQGYLAQVHSQVTAKNINLLMSGGDESKLASYKPPKGQPIALVSLGRKEAVAQFPFMTISGCIPGMIKSRDLFVGKTRKTMGVGSKPRAKTEK
ncbi:hypothetical protein AQUCO_00900708v1 [Aquilegia coerulea]|uniref:FAD/NAD(P)-binding domain-containing protein n=1 Tax=Aquilegia coerulea TaxID=218851 RepID=A0A2G5EF10_AQUCA|nr:hypothetical protein AQUCO_00900708v1 [Aquilegia coerulea]